MLLFIGLIVLPHSKPISLIIVIKILCMYAWKTCQNEKLKSVHNQNTTLAWQNFQVFLSRRQLGIAKKSAEKYLKNLLSNHCAKHWKHCFYHERTLVIWMKNKKRESNKALLKIKWPTFFICLIKMKKAKVDLFCF